MVDRNFYVRIFYVLYVALHLFAYEVLGLETKLAGKNYDKQWEQKYQTLKRFAICRPLTFTEGRKLKGCWIHGVAHMLPVFYLVYIRS